MRPRSRAVNHLISPIPGTPGARFAGLEAVELGFGEVLHRAGKRIDQVYFPRDCAVSLLTSGAHGQTPVEVGLVGFEGMVGASIALGADLSTVRAEVQGKGSALRMGSAPFLAAIERSKAFRRKVYRYTHEATAQIVQTAACNRNHTVEQRLARWLLMMRERVLRDRIELTQRFLGFMVGVRRAGINEAAAGLQRRNLIRVRRGSIEILDPTGLEAAACRCFRLLKIRRPVSA
jgi:CRP-like cAMP-binding protein